MQKKSSGICGCLKGSSNENYEQEQDYQNYDATGYYQEQPAVYGQFGMQPSGAAEPVAASQPAPAYAYQQQEPPPMMVPGGAAAPPSHDAHSSPYRNQVLIVDNGGNPDSRAERDPPRRQLSQSAKIFHNAKSPADVQANPYSLMEREVGSGILLTRVTFYHFVPTPSSTRHLNKVQK